MRPGKMSLLRGQRRRSNRRTRVRLCEESSFRHGSTFAPESLAPVRNALLRRAPPRAYAPPSFSVKRRDRLNADEFLLSPNRRDNILHGVCRGEKPLITGVSVGRRPGSSQLNHSDARSSPTVALADSLHFVRRRFSLLSSLGRTALAYVFLPPSRSHHLPVIPPPRRCARDASRNRGKIKVAGRIQLEGGGRRERRAGARDRDGREGCKGDGDGGEGRHGTHAT